MLTADLTVSLYQPFNHTTVPVKASNSTPHLTVSEAENWDFCKLQLANHWWKTWSRQRECELRKFKLTVCFSAGSAPTIRGAENEANEKSNWKCLWKLNNCSDGSAQAFKFLCFLMNRSHKRHKTTEKNKKKTKQKNYWASKRVKGKRKQVVRESVRVCLETLFSQGEALWWTHSPSLDELRSVCAECVHLCQRVIFEDGKINAMQWNEPKKKNHIQVSSHWVCVG